MNQWIGVPKYPDEYTNMLKLNLAIPSQLPNNVLVRF